MQRLWRKLSNVSRPDRGEHFARLEMAPENLEFKKDVPIHQVDGRPPRGSSRVLCRRFTER